MSSSESAGMVCCDPYARHKAPIKKTLRKISASNVLRNPVLTGGLYWCDNCRNYKAAKNESQEHAADMVADIQEKDQEPSTANVGAILQGLGQCCNPYKIHSKPVLKGLRVIKEADLLRLSTLTVGLLWCDTCRKNNPDDYLEKEDIAEPVLATLFKEIAEELSAVPSEPNSQEICSQASGSSSISPSLSPVVHKESASRSLVSLGLSPLITSRIKTEGGRVSVVKRKVEEATAVVKKKLCRAFSVKPDDVESAESEKVREYDLLLEEIRQRLPNASKIKKYQLLSLVPLSMTLNEASNFFGVSRTVLQKARTLRQKHGILAVPDFHRESTVLQSTKDLVEAYYCSDENSKVLPGARDCISIRKGVYEQKRLILSNLPELYQAFKRDYPGLKIGVSMFCSLRPKWCVFAGNYGTHEQCICQIHQNFKLVLHALNIKTRYQDLIEQSVCDPKDRSCMLRLCEKCPSLETLKEILQQRIIMPDVSESEFSSSEDESDYFEESVRYRQWKSTDRTEMVVLICTRSELLNTAAKQMHDLIPHDFISCSQRDYLKKMKEDLPITKAVVAMDFSMNYNCLVQGAVQSYHWSPKQATVHPTGIYYKDDQNELKYTSIIFISDDLEHDVPLVKKFQERTMIYIKNKLSHIDEVEYATDGCASQYKSKGYFKNLCLHEKEFGLKASHTYFATSHGKSQCDADGGSVKRTARRASLQRPLDHQILNATDLYEFCQEKLRDKFLFELVLKSDVDPGRQVYKSLVKTLETVPGTRSFHYIKPLSDDKLACWRVSKDQSEPPSIQHNLQKQPSEPNKLTVSSGMYVVSRVAKNRYVGVITDVYEETGEADLNLLMPKLPKNEFTWPKEMKTATVPLPHILCQVCLSTQENESIPLPKKTYNYCTK